jgi:autotransporter-associated beta strand protein
MKQPRPFKSIFQAQRVGPLAAALACLWTNSGTAQQFNRIGYTVPIAECYSATAAASLGGEQALQVDMYNACAGANVVQQNSGTGAYWHIVGYHMSTQDPNGDNASATISAVAGYADVSSFCTSVGAGDCNYVASYTDVSGLAYQPGFYSTVAAATGAWWDVFAHEMGHNFGCAHADGLGNGFRTVMLHNYCGGWDLNYYTNPSLYYGGIQLLGSLAGDCNTGSLLNNGNNAGIVALAAPGKQGSRPAPTDTTNAIYHWTFTNAPGTVAAGTTVPDQFGKFLTVRGNGAVFSGTGLRLPGGTTGNLPASSLAAYLDLPNGIISSLTNLTLEIWATPLSGQSLERLFSFGQMSGPGDGLGATGEWSGTPGTPAPGNSSAVNELGLALADGSGNLATENFFGVTNSVTTNLAINVSTAPATRHYYALTFQDNVGAYGTAGGRITCYRDDDGNPTSFLDVNFHLRNINDVNAWLGRSQYVTNEMANVEYSEVRLSNVALTPPEIYGNYLLGGGNARTLFNPALTAVHCGGAAVGTLATDQRTFAADQAYTGGTAATDNGYSYTVDVRGVTNPAPQTAYQEHRYGNMSYTFTNYQAGANYLVRLHFCESYWSASGQRIFNVLLNGTKVLGNFDIYAAAGAQNKAVIKEISTTAKANGTITVQFSNVVDNASISAIEVLQGGLFVPVDVTAIPGVAQASISWSAVLGATSYHIKRATVSGGPYVTIASTTSTNYTDIPLMGTTTYFYVISAVNGGNESFNSIEASATTPVTVSVDTWNGGSGNNFSTLTNWLYSIGSGPVSNTDALVFGSVGSTTPYNDESGFSYSTINFNPGAESFTLGGNAFTLGTNSLGPVISVNSANPQTINNNITLLNATQTMATVSGNLKLGGVLTGTGILNKTGNQILTLSGNNSFTGAMNVNGGTLAIPAGTLAPTAALTLGNVAGGAAVLDISGGSVKANYNGGEYSSSLIAGNASGSAADVRLRSGTLTVNQQLGLGNGNGGYGAFELSGGTATIGSYLVVGLNTDHSVFNQSSGTLNISANLMTIAAGGSGSVGVANLSGGTFNSKTTSGGVFVGEFGVGTLNVSGTALLTLAGSNLKLGVNSGASGMVNLLGGTITTPGITAGSGTALFNFAGGTLRASAASTTFLSGLAETYIYGGGANINDGGYAISIGQPLLVPAGYGVSAITVNNGGMGYIAPPVVTLTGGIGIGATATAQINPAIGAVTNILITNPGSGYANDDVLTLSFVGGGGSGATVSTPVLAANNGGGLNKTGAGTLTLAGANTYTGPTTISQGKLALTSGGAIGSSTSIMLSAGTTFDVSAAGGYTLGATQTLEGFGAVNGIITVNGTLAPGASGTGTLTFSNPPALQGIVVAKINRNGGSPLNDQIRLPASQITFGGALNVTNLGLPLQAGDTFKIFSAPAYSGTFATYNLPSLGANLYWTNTLAQNGTLAVINLISTAPANLVGNLNGTNLTLSWSADHVGWRLLVQTNNLSAGLSANTNDWTTVANSAGTNTVSLPVDLTQSAEFYQLVYP